MSKIAKIRMARKTQRRPQNMTCARQPLGPPKKRKASANPRIAARREILEALIP
ncbi:MAG: hypothetical protein ACI9VS_002517 [Candidatus Binatia bacterium]|jgi:hypothetical protein